MNKRSLIAAAALLAAACSETTVPTAPLAGSATLDRAGEHAGAVFTATNAIAGNAVVAFSRAADGSLTPAGTFATGGNGIGGANDPLASQYSLVLDRDDDLLFVVNAGSNDVSTFRVSGAHLTLIGRTPSGGVLPVSLSVSHDVLYVLNAGSRNVAGFDIDEHGILSADADASSPLGAAADGPAAIRASRDGRLLVVTEKGSKTIDSFEIGSHGTLGSPVTSASAGDTPFGFDFAKNGQIAVSEAGSGAASLYRASRNGNLAVESASISTNGQAAPCWLIANEDGRFVYTANAGSGTLSGYSVSAHGTLTLLNASGVTASTGAGSTPLDLDVSRGSRFLYVLESGAGRIGAFAIASNGNLTALTAVGGVVASGGFQGLAAY